MGKEKQESHRVRPGNAHSVKCVKGEKVRGPRLISGVSGISAAVSESRPAREAAQSAPVPPS